MSGAGLPVAGAVIGIDVGWSTKRRSSAICRLDWTATDVTWTIKRFRAVPDERRQIIGEIADRPALAAAIDGPLTRDFGVIENYRAAECMLTSGFQPRIGKPGQSSSPNGKLLNEQANLCAEIMAGRQLIAVARHVQAIHQSAIVEAFPTSFLGTMLAEPGTISFKKGRRSDSYFSALANSGAIQRLLIRLLPGRTISMAPSDVRNHDDRAALICAITALAVAADDYVAVGDTAGWIILPPAKAMASWARDQLAINMARSLGTVAFVPASVGHA